MAGAVKSTMDATQVILNEERCDVHIWVGLVPAVKGLSSTDSRESYASCRCTLAERSDCSGGNGALRCERHCSQKAAIPLKRRKFTRESSPEMRDIVEAYKAEIT